MNINEIASKLPNKGVFFRHNTSDMADCIQETKTFILFLGEPLSKLHIAFILEKMLGYPHSEQLGGYAVYNKHNPYRFILDTSSPIEINSDSEINADTIIVIDSSNAAVVFTSEERDTVSLLLNKVVKKHEEHEEKIKQEKRIEEVISQFYNLSDEEKGEVLTSLVKKDN